MRVLAERIDDLFSFVCDEADEVLFRGFKDHDESSSIFSVRVGECPVTGHDERVDVFILLRDFLCSTFHCGAQCAV